MFKKITRDFYARDTEIVAKELLGKYFIHSTPEQERIARIVEVEAYVGRHDLASHSAKGMTPRTTVMFGPPGYAYVYLIYGLYHCLNVVTETEGVGAAVLIRALEPIKNITARTQGPGLLCQALAIDRRWNGYDLLSDNFYIASSDHEEIINIVSKPRIGVHYAKEWADKLLRFYIQDNPFVSKK